MNEGWDPLLRKLRFVCLSEQAIGREIVRSKLSAACGIRDQRGECLPHGMDTSVLVTILRNMCLDEYRFASESSERPLSIKVLVWCTFYNKYQTYQSSSEFGGQHLCNDGEGQFSPREHFQIIFYLPYRYQPWWHCLRSGRP